jgi:hypothetical protein
MQNLRIHLKLGEKQSITDIRKEMGNGLGAWIQFFSGRLQVSYGMRYL